MDAHDVYKVIGKLQSAKSLSFTKGIIYVDGGKLRCGSQHEYSYRFSKTEKANQYKFVAGLGSGNPKPNPNDPIYEFAAGFDNELDKISKSPPLSTFGGKQVLSGFVLTDDNNWPELCWAIKPTYSTPIPRDPDKSDPAESSEDDAMSIDGRMNTTTSFADRCV